MVREKIGEKDHVPNVAYATFNKRFRPPQPEEGFEEVRNIYFEAKFPSAKFEKVFLEYTWADKPDSWLALNCNLCAQ